MPSARTNLNQYDRELKCVKNENVRKSTKKTYVHQKITIKTLDGQFEVRMWTQEKKPEPGNSKALIPKSKSLESPKTMPPMPPSIPESEAPAKDPARGASKKSNRTPKDASKPEDTTKKSSSLDLTDAKQLAELAKWKGKKVKNTSIKEPKDVPKIVQCSHSGCFKKFRDETSLRKHVRTHLKK